MAETRVIWENDSYVGQSLTPDEVATLEDNVFNVIAKDSDDLTSLYRDNWGKIQGALQVAKDQLSATYGGFSASDGEIGVSMIRPGHLLRDANGTETANFQNWTRTFTADGDYWIGYDATHTTAINVDSRIGAILILGVYFTHISERTSLLKGSVAVDLHGFAPSCWRERARPLCRHGLPPPQPRIWRQLA